MTIVSDFQISPVGGGEGKAAAMHAMTWQVAYGRGDPSWDAISRGASTWYEALTPDAAEARTLVDEIGRRVADEVSYVTPDDNGDIVLSDGRWSRVTGPTRHLHIAVQLDFGDAAGETIREIGLFCGGSAIGGTPPGQMWWPPAVLANPGYLIRLERLAYPYPQQPNTRYGRFYVETF